MTATLENKKATHKAIAFQTYNWPAFWPVTARCHLQKKRAMVQLSHVQP